MPQFYPSTTVDISPSGLITDEAAREAIAEAAGGGVAAFPTPSNNEIALMGDSRSANSSYDTSYQTTVRMMQTGFAPWLLMATGYRVKITDNYAVAGQDLWYNRDQLTSVPGSGVSVYKGNILTVTGTPTATNPAPTNAGGAIFLAGANGINGSRPGYAGSSAPWDGATGTKPFYDEITSAFVAANKVLILCNEMPNNHKGTGQGVAQNLERRNKLDAYDAGSDLVVKANTYDAMAATPYAQSGKRGYFGDDLHETRTGGKVLGEYLATIVNQVYASFPTRNQLPPGNNSAGYLWSSDMVGTVAGTNITGSVFPTGTTATATTNAGLTITAAAVTNADGFTEIVLTVTGTGANAGGSRDNIEVNRLLNAGSAASPILLNGIGTADGDSIYSLCRVSVDPNPVGLLSVGAAIQGQCSSPSFNASANAAELPPSEFSYSGDLPGGWDYPVLSQPLVLPVGWSSTATSRLFNAKINVRYRGSGAVSFVVRISQFGAVKNR